MQQDIIKILTRFRKNKVAIACDIAEMYMNVEIAEEDRKFFRFLWRYTDNPAEVRVFEFQRLIFGGNASPFLAQLVSRENAITHKEDYPRACEIVLESTYMDDSLDSEHSTGSAIELYKQLEKLWGKADMPAWKWLSNDPEVLKQIPQSKRADNIKLGEDSSLPTTKTLGLAWNAEEDVFVFEIKVPEEFVYTKRCFLKIMAAILDPLGFLTPFLVRAKIVMQTLWVKKYDWDETVDEEISLQMRNWINEIQEISKFKIPRCLTLHIDQKRDEEIHIFEDASE